MKQYTIEEIKGIAEDFTQEVFQGKPRNNMCFVTCLPLSILLTRMGIKNSLKVGYYNYDKNPNSIPCHYWIYLDEQNKILDPTIRQFIEHENEEEVYVGELKSTFKEFTNAEFNKWFSESIIDWWENMFGNSTNIFYPLPENMIIKMNSQCKGNRKVNRNLYDALQTEFSNLEFYKTDFTEQEKWIECLYFGVIKKILIEENL
ncbi:MAG: hypothetical protein RIQ33_1090 [Bacteroidota bacterium]|jgi:hypothetical protein